MATSWPPSPVWTGRELVYCDPPYLFGARASQERIYRHELGDLDHVRLLHLVKRLPCMVMVSGYFSPLYARELADWRLVTFPAMTRAPARVIEHLWCNFPAPKALHDYRYLGTGYRERERIKKKTRRWRRKFLELDALEQQAVLTACLADDDDGRSTTTAAGEARRRPSQAPQAKPGDKCMVPRAAWQNSLSAKSTVTIDPFCEKTMSTHNSVAFIAHTLPRTFVQLSKLDRV